MDCETIEVERDLLSISKKYNRCRPFYFWYEYIDTYYGPGLYQEELDRVLDFHLLIRKKRI
jgi:hypothetical protein